MIQQRALSHSLPEQAPAGTSYWEAEDAERFETYYERIFNYIRYRVHCRYTAEDLTSQVFEKMAAKRSTFRADRSPLEVWLFALARNTVNDYFRTQRRRRLLPLDDCRLESAVQKGPESLAITRESEERLLRAVNTLRSKEKHVVALKFGAGLRNVDIAEITGISESNVGVLLYRAMKKLKLELEGEDNDE